MVSEERDGCRWADRSSAEAATWSPGGRTLCRRDHPPRENSVWLRPKGLWSLDTGCPGGPSCPRWGLCAHSAPSPSRRTAVRCLLPGGHGGWGTVRPAGPGAQTATPTAGYQCGPSTHHPGHALRIPQARGPPRGPSSPQRDCKIVESPFKAHGNYFQGFIAPESRQPRPPGQEGNISPSRTRPWVFTDGNETVHRSVLP